jgi:hypothetical protein
VKKLAERLVETWNDELALEATLEQANEAGHGQRIQLRGALARHYASVVAGFHVLRSTASASPALVSVQVDDEDVLDVIVRTYEFSGENRVKSHPAVDPPEDPFPTAEHLRQEAWEALPEHVDFKFET